MDGENTIEACQRVTSDTLQAVFAALYDHRVTLEGMLLKPNMVIAGKGCPVQNSTEKVAKATVRTFLQVVPAAVPGIVFLSGGQSPELATAHLDAMNRLGHFPWELSFSYGRALQAPTLQAWSGNPSQVPEAQALYLKRAKLNGAARYGQYAASME